jgi:putative membrane protein
MPKSSLAALISLALVACGEDKPAKSPTNESPTMSQGTTPTSMPATTATTAPEPVATTTATQEPTPPPPPVETLSDAQIVLIGITADQSEVDAGKMAQTKATHAEVKAFAAMMVKDHTDAMKKKNDMAKKLSLTPADSTHSTQLKTDAQQMATELQALKGKDFDSRYIETQVKAHQQVLDLLDQKMIPNAKNADLKSELETVRAKVADHLKKAQEIQAKLAQPGATKAGTVPTTGDHGHHQPTQNPPPSPKK